MMKIQRSLFLYCLRPGDFRKEALIKGKKFTPHLLLITFEMVNIMPFTINVLHEYKSKCFREKQACYYPDWFVLFVCISSSNEKPLSRRARLAQLCTYLQERYKHLCRHDRAATRHSRLPLRLPESSAPCCKQRPRLHCTAHSETQQELTDLNLVCWTWRVCKDCVHFQGCV